MSAAPTKLLNQPFRFFLLKNKSKVILGLTCLFFTNSLETLIPWLVGKTLDRVTAEAPLREVSQIVVWIFVIIVFLSAFRFLWRFFWSQFHHSVAEDLRNRLFDRMMDLGPSFFRPRKIGELISIITNDVNSFRMGIGPGLLIMFDGLFLIVLILPMMISISRTWTWQTLALMPLVPFAVKGILDRLHANYHNRQKRFGEMSGSAQEIVSGIRVIKSFAQETNQTSQFNQHSSLFREACDRVAWWDSIFGPTLELPVALGSVILLLIGADRVVQGEVTLGQFFAFYQYIQRMIWPMSAIGIAMGHVQEGRAAFRRIRDVLEFTPDVPDHGTHELTHIERLEVKNLSFTYPGAPVPALENVSFCLARGQSLGIVGVTGSGKSTLIDLLTRQYPVPNGTILINDISIEDYTLSSLRKVIAVVPQEAFLFSRKVSENIALGKEQWTLDDVKDSAEQVRLNQEIESWPEAYNAFVGERGVNLSGGQKQRMTLARAILRKAQLVILDDSLSAVDATTEEQILRLLRGELESTTSIVVSHRLASVKNADQILVLSHGKIDGLDSHQQLLGQSSIYRGMYEMQTGETSS